MAWHDKTQHNKTQQNTTLAEGEKLLTEAMSLVMESKIVATLIHYHHCNERDTPLPSAKIEETNPPPSHGWVGGWKRRIMKE